MWLWEIVSQIVKDGNNLPPELNIQVIDGLVEHIIYSNNASFFSDSVYKKVKNI